MKAKRGTIYIKIPLSMHDMHSRKILMLQPNPYETLHIQQPAKCKNNELIKIVLFDGSHIIKDNKIAATLCH